MTLQVPVATVETRYLWHIELVPSVEEDGGLTKPFTGIRKEAETYADRLADAADFEVARCILHRRGPAPS
jgi:hypothetical protein